MDTPQLDDTKPKQIDIARRVVLERPTATLEAQAKLSGTSISTVRKARAELIEEGLLSPSYRAPLFPPKSTPETTGDKLIKSLPSEEIGKLLEDYDGSLTPQDMRKILHGIAATADNPANRIQAIIAIARLDAQEGKRDTLGPGPPLTDDDKVHRLSLLLEACGKTLAREAWGKAFKPDTATNDLPITQAQDPETTPNP